MYGIDSPTATAGMPSQAAAGVAGWFTGGSPTTGLPATIVTADWLNGIQAEILNVLSSAGISPAKTELDQLSRAVQILGSIRAYSSSFAGGRGYPFNAIVADAGTSGLYWRSTADNNTTTPGSSGASWAAIVTDTTLLQWKLITSSTTITLPAWARGFEIKAIAGGGSGAYCYSSGTTQVSGGGGGAGGFAWGYYYPGSGTVLTLSVGAQGGNTTVAWNGSTNISCYGGGSAAWPTNWSSPGGDGGGAGGGNIMNVTGGRGNDGMAGTSASGQVAYNIGARGSSSQFGEGGRAGQGGGADAVGYGAGGGGAYDLTGSATVHNGGAGMQGCVLIRFLP